MANNTSGVAHENLTRKSIGAERTPGRGCLWVVAWLAAASSGCDIVQGYQNTGDALFPEQGTYLAAPGLRLVRGPYTGLSVVAGAEVYLLAREADDATGKLVSMRYAAPHPCEIPGVGRFSATEDKSRSAPLVSYFRDHEQTGTLHFADATCRTFSLTFDDARLPVSETATSVVVRAGTDLWLATPETGSQELLASGVDRVMNRVLGQHRAVRAEGRLMVFDVDWKEQASFGDEVDSVLLAGESLFYTDSVGVHRLVVSEADSSVIESELLVEDACSLGGQDDTWVTLRSPCSGGEVLAIHEPTGRSFTLPFEADALQVMLVPALKSPGLDPLADPFWFFYLRSGAAEGSERSLFVRTPSGDEHLLGARATLQHLRLLESKGETHGYALIDVEGETGRYIWWNAVGETKVLAERAMWRPDRLIVDYDGTLGNVAVAAGDRLLTLAEGVLWDAFEFGDGTNRWTALFHDVQLDGAGKLSVFPSGIDALESVPLEKPLIMPKLSPVASNVIAFSTSSLYEVLSGVTYLTRFDPSTLTGRLEYRNLDLRFTAHVNDGVSSYLVGYDEILYTIPYGNDAGIWLASAK